MRMNALEMTMNGKRRDARWEFLVSAASVLSVCTSLVVLLWHRPFHELFGLSVQANSLLACLLPDMVFIAVHVLASTFNFCITMDLSLTRIAKYRRPGMVPRNVVFGCFPDQWRFPVAALCSLASVSFGAAILASMYGFDVFLKTYSPTTHALGTIFQVGTVTVTAISAIGALAIMLSAATVKLWPSTKRRQAMSTDMAMDMTMTTSESKLQAPKPVAILESRSMSVPRDLEHGLSDLFAEHPSAAQSGKAMARPFVDPSIEF